MKKIITVALVAFAAASLPAFAAELTDQDRSELRQRAEEFQSQRARNPDFQPGESRPQPTERTDRRPKRAVKAHVTQSAQKETLRHKAARKARSLEHIPGAFVHRR